MNPRAPQLDESRAEGAIVDLDGVVLDSLGVWRDVDLAYLAAHGLADRPDVVDRLNNSSTLMDAALYLHRDCGVRKEPRAICDEFHAILGDFYRETLLLMPGAREALDALKARGARLALVTASPADLVHAALRRNRADFYFDFFFCGADKLDRDVFRRAVAALGTDVSRTTVYDDLGRIRAVAESLGFATRPSLTAAAASLPP